MLGGAGPIQPQLASFLPDWLNPDVFLRDSPLGPWVVLLVCAIVFAETGLLVGFFLPGDSMLFTAGLLVSTGAISFNLWGMCALIIVAAAGPARRGAPAGPRRGAGGGPTPRAGVGRSRGGERNRRPPSG